MTKKINFLIFVFFAKGKKKACQYNVIISNLKYRNIKNVNLTIYIKKIIIITAKKIVSFGKQK